MSFFIKFASILFLTGTLAWSIGTPRDSGIIGDNPLGNLIDAKDLQDDSALDRLGAMSSNNAPAPATQSLGNRFAHFLYDRSMILQSAVNKLGFICPVSVSLFNGRDDVRFILYNKNWPHGTDISKDLGASKLLPNTPIKFLIHGFLNSGNSMMIQVIKNAYMAREEDYNVIAVDWTKGSGSWLSNYVDCLITSRIVPKVGEAVAEFIVDLINKQDVNILYVNVIGHSLGAQISGRAGKKLTEMGYRLPIIVGLDPALPGFQYSPETERLAPSDAIYVEVIHTNPGDLGFETPLGTADYYPNWGMIKRNRQPSCITPACSHAMSFRLFAESIANPTGFEAYQCDSFESMKKGECTDKGNNSPVRAYMGGAELRYGKAPGVFKLETNQFAPFAKTQ